MRKTAAELIAGHLPYLRRFSRALNGSQEHGDAYVVAMLEALLADQKVLRRDLAPKIALFQLFVRVWNSIPINRESDPVLFGNGDGLIEKEIETLTPRPRQAFLLIAVEEFSTSQIAIILETSEEEVRKLIDSASRQIAAQVGRRVLAFEDDPPAAEIEDIVAEIGHELIGRYSPTVLSQIFEG